MPVDIGTGASIAFGTSSFTANITAINGEDITRESIQTSHLGTTGSHTFIPAKLVDPGGIQIDFQFDPDDYPPIDQAPETITVTFPLTAAGGTAATWAATGFMTNFSWGAPLEELMTGSATVKFSGDITDTDEAGA